MVDNHFVLTLWTDISETQLFILKVDTRAITDKPNSEYQVEQDEVGPDIY